MFGRDNISLLYEFNEHLNCHRIDRNDVSQYKSFDDIREVVKIASFKQAQKELKSSTHVVFEDEHWLMIKPLTFESSRKYGSSTKWCTTMENNKNYFYNYSTNGVLVYIFNKVTNMKTAAHIRLQEKSPYDNPVKLYNEQDVETDSYVLKLPTQVMETIDGRIQKRYYQSKTSLSKTTQRFTKVSGKTEVKKRTVRWLKKSQYLCQDSQWMKNR